MIRRGFHAAETEEEKLAVYRLRYDVYVEEMGRYRAAADHERRLLVEPEDATARIFYAAPEGEVVATARLSWGGDARFSARQIEHYQLEPFLAELPPEVIAVASAAWSCPACAGAPSTGNSPWRASASCRRGASSSSSARASRTS